MKLSRAGVVADILWYENKTPRQNVVFGEFVVMPNHVHEILIIDGNDAENNAQRVVETRSTLSLRYPENNPPTPKMPKTFGQQRFQNRGKILCRPF